MTNEELNNNIDRYIALSMSLNFKEADPYRKFAIEELRRRGNINEQHAHIMDEFRVWNSGDGIAVRLSDE